MLLAARAPPSAATAWLAAQTVSPLLLGGMTSTASLNWLLLRTPSSRTLHPRALAADWTRCELNPRTGVQRRAAPCQRTPLELVPPVLGHLLLRWTLGYRVCLSTSRRPAGHVFQRRLCWLPLDLNRCDSERPCEPPQYACMTFVFLPFHACNYAFYSWDTILPPPFVFKHSSYTASAFSSFFQLPTFASP